MEVYYNHDVGIQGIWPAALAVSYLARPDLNGHTWSLDRPWVSFKFWVELVFISNPLHRPFVCHEFIHDVIHCRFFIPLASARLVYWCAHHACTPSQGLAARPRSCTPKVHQMSLFVSGLVSRLYPPIAWTSRLLKYHRFSIICIPKKIKYKMSEPLPCTRD